MKFRKKPVVIEAMLWDPASGPYEIGAVVGWLMGNGFNDFHHPDSSNLLIQTLEGWMNVSPGDWIIRGINGEFYPCKPDIFDATYEAVTDAD